MIWKIIFTSYFSEFIHQVVIKFKFQKAVGRSVFNPTLYSNTKSKSADKILKTQTPCLRNFVIKFYFILNIKVINMTGHSSKTNKLRNINTVGYRTRNRNGKFTISKSVIWFITNFNVNKTIRYR